MKRETSGDLSAIAQSVIRTYGEHDVDALAALYAADATLVFPGATFAGRDEIKGMWRGWFDAFPDVASQTHRVWTAADSFALEWTERGAHNGEFVVAGRRIPATGRRLEWTGVSCYEVADGEIRAVRYYIDPAPLMRVLGAA